MCRLFGSLLLGLALLSPSIQSFALAQSQDSIPTARLEQQKLQLEIRELSRAWFLRPEYLAAILPAVVGMGTLLILRFTGYFKAETIRLENRRSELKNDIRQFESQKAELDKQLAEAEITVQLERLVRVMEPNNAVGVQRKINRALGQAPSETDLIPLQSIRGLVAAQDGLAPTRIDILRGYLDKPTTPPEMKDELRAILESNTVGSG